MSDKQYINSLELENARLEKKIQTLIAELEKKDSALKNRNYTIQILHDQIKDYEDEKKSWKKQKNGRSIRYTTDEDVGYGFDL